MLLALYALVAYAPRRVAAAGAAVAIAGTIPFALHFDELARVNRVVVATVLALHLVLAAVLGDHRRVVLRERAAEFERRAHWAHRASASGSPASCTTWSATPWRS